MTRNGRGTIVAIELTNKCNLRCTHCPQGEISVSEGYMDRKTFIQSLEYCNGYTELNWRGEPLMHPNLVEYVRIAKDFSRTLNLGFHSNGILMTEQLFKELLISGLDWIHVSLHTHESCSKYKRMMEWNSELGNKVHLYAEVDTTQEELMARSYGFSDNMFQRLHLANWAGYLTDYRIIHHYPKTRAQNCMFVKENKFIVAWNGMVNACCWDFEQLHCLGNVSDFENIRHNTPYKLCASCIWIILDSSAGTYVA